MTDRLDRMGRSDHFYAGAMPVPEVAEGARRFQQGAGITSPNREDYGHVVMPKPVAKQVADAYDQLPDFDQKAVPAYKAMSKETHQQYEHLTRPKEEGGMGIQVEVTKEDPYGRSGMSNVVRELRQDVSRGRIKVLSTASTGGHPFFSNEENDKFRAVHDVFGHLGSGRGIDPHGEEAAFQKHSQMYSPLARQAMATETRGQNSWVNTYGEGKTFPKQKVALLPEHMQSLQFSEQASTEDRMAALQAARRRNQKQGIE